MQPPDPEFYRSYWLSKLDLFSALIAEMDTESDTWNAQFEAVSNDLIALLRSALTGHAQGEKP